VHTLSEADSIVFMSGRDEVCRKETEDWLLEELPFEWAELWMRAEGDQRKDSIVKRELFDAHVRDRWQVLGVVDDRDSVVSMWRDLGLTVAQVAYGNF
jgi:hypothetical protein